MAHVRHHLPYSLCASVDELLARRLPFSPRSKRVTYRASRASRRRLCHCAAGCLLFLPAALALTACSSNDGDFHVEGRFLNLNQGEFYVYSLDGAIEGMDTVKIDGGRFSHDMPCNRKGMLTLVFPNFTEQIIIAEPGKTVTVKADASHLREMEAKGTKENELLSRFRKATSAMTQAEATTAAEKFIKDNPDAIASAYVLRRYFVRTTKPDYDKAAELAALMAKQPDAGGFAARLRQEIDLLRTAEPGKRMPHFTAITTEGKPLDSNDLTGKPTVLINVASWNFESLNQQRILNRVVKANRGKLNAVSFCIDPNVKDIERTLKRDSITWPVVCDGGMFQSQLLRQTGLYGIPDNMLIDSDGRIVKHGVATRELKKEAEKLLKP